MKYIRTKNNLIYEVVEEYNTTYLVKTHENYRNIKKAIDGTRIVYKASCIKQADTIEELCDEFVVVVKNNPFIPSKNYIVDDYLTAYQGYKTDNTNELYGAIWTKKGLIYVAKMNESGCLELLWGGWFMSKGLEALKRVVESFENNGN